MEGRRRTGHASRWVVDSVADAARAYRDLELTPALHIEPRDYQQAALDAWVDHGRRGSVVLPTGSGKTFLGLQAIADAGVSALVVTPTIDLMNQWHATLTNAFGDQLAEPNGVLGGGSHEITAITVTTYDSAYRYINEYGDRFGLLVVDEEHHLPARESSHLITRRGSGHTTAPVSTSTATSNGHSPRSGSGRIRSGNSCERTTCSISVPR